MNLGEGHYRRVVIRYLIATAGLLLVALGIALSIVANLGTSPLSCPSYVLEGIWGLTVGNWTILVNTTYMLVQLVVLRKNFKVKYLMQIPASVVFGYLIDFCLLCCGWMHPESLAARLGIDLLACIITSLGVSIEVIARAWMLSAEMTVYSISKTFGKSFGGTKVAMDTTVLVLAAVLSYILCGNPLGREEAVVIGIGTVILALLPGFLMRLTDPVADRLMDLVIFRETGVR